jgi:hypothetical protein
MWISIFAIAIAGSIALSVAAALLQRAGEGNPLRG